MTASKRERILKAGLALSVLCLVCSVILLILSSAGPHGITVMIMTGIVGLLTGLTFFLQLGQKKRDT